MEKFSHINHEGMPEMVDVSGKGITKRFARAVSKIVMQKKFYDEIKKGDSPKGNIFITAKIAGINAAKKTAELIPLCHPIKITKVNLSFKTVDEENAIVIESYVQGEDRTGFEMEALTSASVAALTIYDMIKSLDKSARITDIMLVEKAGGKSGHFVRKEK